MRRRLALSLVTLLGLLTLASGCGDDSPEPAATVTSTETVEASETTSSTTSTASTTSTSTSGDGEAPPADQTVSELTGFTSPTGNIGCLIDRGSVRCDIQERDWEPPKAPPDCQLDYGQGISLDAGGEPALVCAGDTALGAGEPLPYGQSIAAGLLRCESEESGMSCRDVETGRGFSLSREGYELF